MRRLLLTAMLAAGISSSALAAGPRVVASIKPVQSLAAQVMEGIGAPDLLVRGGASPHTYAMKPSDAKALGEAALVFWIGPDLESFLVKPLDSVKGRAVALDQVPDVTLLDAREGGMWEAHDHGVGDDHGHHDHDQKAREINAHIWLDPLNAKAMVVAIASELIKTDPEHAATYRANADAAAKRLDALDADLAATLAPVKDRPFIVFHDAYPYLENRYELKAVGAITVSPERLPSAKRLTEIRAKLKALRAVCVFAEPQFEPALVDTLLEGTSAKKGVLDPEGAALPDGPGLYGLLLKFNAKALVDCLS